MGASHNSTRRLCSQGASRETLHHHAKLSWTPDAVTPLIRLSSFVYTGRPAALWPGLLPLPLRADASG